LCTHNTPAAWTEWNALVADNVAQAADATIQSLQRGVFAVMRALGLAGYRWALPRISSLTWISIPGCCVGGVIYGLAKTFPDSQDSPALYLVRPSRWSHYKHNSTWTVLAGFWSHCKVKLSGFIFPFLEYQEPDSEKWPDIRQESDTTGCLVHPYRKVRVALNFAF